MRNGGVTALNDLLQQLFNFLITTDTLYKCSIKNENGCFLSLFQSIVYYASENGIPELNVPLLNPLTLNDTSVDILDTFTASVNGGKIDGVKDCVYSQFLFDLENRITTQEITCDLTIEGAVKLTGESPAAQSVLGVSSMNADGNGKLKLDRLTLRFEGPFQVLKYNDGEIYLVLDDKNVKFQYNLPNAFFSSDRLIIGNTDYSKEAVDYLNKHYRELMKDIGDLFVGTGKVIYLNVANQFFRSLPAKYYIIENLSPYVQN
ncbi:uncharacterized protein LOC120630134 [Pararge aegeria]|uniref:uncharacterized protein LOC120630134 n=1 Tax=Pararge aegeria TaxID=116150 RepID=UPI0019D2AE43|nr:uncharacterized protein LOC120630134 [Pararge aegeria]